ncbi:beta-1,4-glucuronyltransferase 1-like, partial [Penaeus monodon]|uniref:beta-1,4-glucuronyltransferase 1-like n=1 Tax=Penaeus monodon TaxID=6687 RepID=UPI0018A70488
AGGHAAGVQRVRHVHDARRLHLPGQPGAAGGAVARPRQRRRLRPRRGLQRHAGHHHLPAGVPRPGGGPRDLPPLLPGGAHALARAPHGHVLAARTSCSTPPPYLATHTYKRAHNLTYPVNVARNIARRAAATYFVLASDVELYPSRGFIPFFMDMLKRQDASATPAPTRRVYVLPIFEVKSGLRPPASKLALVRMLKRGSAIPFHKFVCPQCHKVPGMREWADSNATESVNVVMVAKRHPPFHHWEPIYVGTHLEPLYDERLSWEGRSDKMTQMYVMCVLDYEFHVLDNAFLVHRPGIKRHRRDRHRDQLTAKQNALLHSKITPELHTIYGKRGACYL